MGAYGAERIEIKSEISRYSSDGRRHIYLTKFGIQSTKCIASANNRHMLESTITFYFRQR